MLVREEVKCKGDMDTNLDTEADEDVPGLLSDEHITDGEYDDNFPPRCTKDVSSEIQRS